MLEAKDDTHHGRGWAGDAETLRKVPCPVGSTQGLEPTRRRVFPRRSRDEVVEEGELFQDINPKLGGFKGHR